MKNIIFLIATIFIFIGCAGKYSTIENSQIIKKQNKAYIEFLRKDQFFGGGADLFVYEVKNNKIIPVIALANNQRFIYEVEKGKHKFYTTPYNIIEIDVEENKTYHIDILPNNNYKFYALIVEDNQDINNAINELQKDGCKENILNKYNFTKRTSDYKSPISLIVTCEDKKLIKYDNLKNTPTLNEINKIPIVSLSESGKKYFKSQLDNETKKFNDYNIFWEQKLKNIPLINEPFMKINKLPSKENIKKYDGIKLTSKLNENIGIDLINDINSEFTSYNGNDKLDIEIIVNKYFVGNFLKRNFTVALNSNFHFDSIAVIDVDVNYYDKGNKIASFNIVTSTDGSGLIFDKINSTHSQIIKEVKNYTQNNFIK
ncbi:hypothetical protein PT520_09440 [Aliarcobacter butzleri]|uniref:Lipoprotein n=1 Tax=Aliarcobacter butzleri TaxID=28197 RepID=A0AAW6VNZ3_9BACT|nr:hypothetical protein [Aliarcobacter butzleri]MDK2062738.1 hypothetical protein [Aliarcobacter butzleri]